MTRILMPADTTMRRRLRLAALALAGSLALAACGGGNPVGNPPDIQNPGTENSSQTLSFDYFQRCVQPIYTAQLRIQLNGQESINTCASSGCHDNDNGTGGALRIVGSAPQVDLTDPANDAATVRGLVMYRNYFSSLGSVQFSSPDDSRLLTKPMVRGVLHGGGLIFESADDPNAKLIRYWISHPMPPDQDEFGANAAAMFNPTTGECLSE